MRIWREILTKGEALLEGRLLVPHPLLPQGHGISLKRFEQNPSPLDLVALARGVGLYPYVAKGDVMNTLNSRRFARLTGGNAGGVALWFN